jgi:hypothetical protein
MVERERHGNVRSIPVRVLHVGNPESDDADDSDRDVVDLHGPADDVRIAPNREPVARASMR